jgi:sphingolipid delta-4 desaturase
MNVYDLDPDIPTEWEVAFFNTTFKKFAFVVLFPVMYTIRPLVKFHKTPNPLEIFNLLAVFLSDYLIYTYIGGWALVWMLISLYMGLRLNNLLCN